MKTEINYYHLTKKQLSFLSSIEAPLCTTDGKRLSTPVVVIVHRDTGRIKRVMTLSWYRHVVNTQFNGLHPNLYTYHIYAKY